MGNSFCSFTFSQLVGRQLYYLFVNLILEMAQSCQPGFLNDEVEQNPFLTSLLPNPGLLKTVTGGQGEVSVTSQIYEFQSVNWYTNMDYWKQYYNVKELRTKEQ